MKRPDLDDDGTITLVGHERPNLGKGEACLVVIYGDELGRRYSLERPATTIGRAKDSDVRVDQEAVSRNHACVRSQDGALTLRDLGSTNGTYVNEQPVRESRLRNGDLVQVGRTIFKVLHGDRVEAAYHEEVFRLSTTDGLTQLYNRRYFMEQVAREEARARRYGRPLSLVILDVDHFKEINDRHGHVGGDHVLRQLATLLRANLRQEDLLGRYGGEEFAILLPETDAEGGRSMAEKIRNLVESARFQFEEESIAVTVSAGISSTAPDTQDHEDLLRSADEKLYEAKRAGRNRVEA